MKIKQAIFTACNRGIEDKSGVCLYSKSKGLSVKAITQFEKNSIYEKNYLFLGDLEKLPVRFFSGVNEEGKYYLQQVKSIQDYNKEFGRMGNIMSHMMQFEEGFPELPPICYYKSVDFYEKLSEELAVAREKPDYLEELEVLSPNPNLNFENICNFIEKRSLNNLFRLILLVIKAQKENKRVIIYDTAENIVYWIAALMYCLPATINRKLSFSTYTYNPKLEKADICGYVKGISKDDIEIKSDSVNEVFYPDEKMEPIENSWFGNIKLSFLMEEYEDIKSFNNFLEKHNFDKLDETVYLAYAVSAILESDKFFESCNYSSGEIFDFAKQWLTREEKYKLIFNMILASSKNQSSVKAFGNQCIDILNSCDKNQNIDLLLEIDKKIEKLAQEGKKRENLYVEYIWKEYLKEVYKKESNWRETLGQKLQLSPLRNIMFMNIQMEYFEENPYEAFVYNFTQARKNQPIGSSWGEIEKRLIQNYLEYIKKNFRGEEKFGMILECLGYLLEFKYICSQIDELIIQVEQNFPIFDFNITMKTKELKKDNGIWLKHKFGTVEISLYKIAADIFDYQCGSRKKLPCERSDLYLLGYDLYIKYMKDNEFKYMKDNSIMKDYFYKFPISLYQINLVQSKKYFEWIMPILTE